MARRIDESSCIGCGACEPICLVGCISEQEDGKRLINEVACVDCGACELVCPVSCISAV